MGVRGLGREAFSVPRLGLSLSVSLCLWLWASQVFLRFPPTSAGTGLVEWAGGGYFSSPMSWLGSGLVPSEGRPCSEVACSGVLQSVPFPPSLAASGVFLWHLLWELICSPGAKSHRVLEAPLLLGFPRVFNSQSCPQGPSINLSITVQIILRGLSSPVVLTPPEAGRPRSPASPGSGSSLPCVLTSPVAPGDVLVCRLLCSVGQSDHFQAPYTQNRKLEVYSSF